MLTRISALLAALVMLCAMPAAAGQAAPAQLANWTDAEIAHFLSTAKPAGGTHTPSKGVTGALRITLTDGTRTHDAQIQKIDQYLSQFVTNQGMELNFRDSWKYNVAAYRLDRLLGLNLVPVSVQRKWRGDDAAYTWWIDDVMMDEGGRHDRKLQAPDAEAWNRQVQLVRILDQLIANTDRNAGNLLITRDWRVWAIDHTRAFRTNKSLKTPKNVTRCDRAVLTALKALDRATLDREVGAVLTRYEIEALLPRRDEIVSIIENAGPAALFDRTGSYCYLLLLPPSVHTICTSSRCHPSRS